jgi:hypothetical protein
MKVPGLAPDFRFHDLRHYFASLLIANGADVKVVQARLRHASATTTLNTHSHLAGLRRGNAGDGCESPCGARGLSADPRGRQRLKPQVRAL